MGFVESVKNEISTNYQKHAPKAAILTLCCAVVSGGLYNDSKNNLFSLFFLLISSYYPLKELINDAQSNDEINMFNRGDTGLRVDRGR